MATIRGTSGGDSLVGGASVDIIYGYGGKDFLYGSDGRDTLYGGDGADWLATKGDSEVLYGGAGSDDVVVQDAFDTRLDLRIDGFQQIGWGDTGLVRLVSIEGISTGAGNDSLNGNDRSNSLASAEGNDTVHGHGGYDTLFLGSGNDLGYGGADDDLLLGEKGNDTLFGETGSDLLNGGGGRDRLIGGQGGDMLTGGAGSVRDDFVFVSAADSRSGVLRRDTIFDFQVGLDKLDLSQIDSDTTKDGDQAFAFSGSEAAALSVWQVVGRSQTRILADTSGDAVADMDILLDDSVTLVATDFIL